jgi:chemotaxis protein methyltransferase CheR
LEPDIAFAKHPAARGVRAAEPRDRRVPVSVRQADLVLCENVLIYFREEITREVIGKLRDTLREGGYLFLGYAETLWGLSEGFTPVSLGDTYVYRRTPVAPKVQTLPPPEAAPGPRAARVSVSLAPSRPAAPPRAAAPQAPHGPRSGPPQGLDCLLATEDLARAQGRGGGVPGAESGVAPRGPPLAASPGAWPQRLEARRQEPALRAYLRRSGSCERQGEDAEAVAQLQQALYLDPKLPLAWFHLGNVFQRQKDARRAAHAYRQTLKLAPHFTPEWDSGFTKALLVKVCEQNIARLSR